MAPTSFPTPPKFMYLLLLFILTFLACEATSQKPRQTKLVFYFQDVASGPNATVIPVAGVPGKIWSFNSFGTIFVVDDPITQTPNRNSTQVGRAQGLFVASALDGSNVHVMLSIVFTNIEYSGSTLEIQGTSRQLQNLRELSVVSGTGRFRFTSGFATLETIYFDARISYSIIRCTITLLQPEGRKYQV